MPDRGQAQAHTDAWLKAACGDAERRGLPQLKPLLETLARSTAALREADRTLREAAAEHPGAPGIPGILE